MKVSIVIGVILLGLGIFFALFSTLEPYTKCDQWSPPKNIAPQATPPAWALWMQAGDKFKVNITASGGRIRVVIGPLAVNELYQTYIRNPIFDCTNFSITWEGKIEKDDTYQVEVRNEGTSEVTVTGEVVAEHPRIRVVYPYTSAATPTLILGVALLIYGFIRKPRKKGVKKR
jgi:hypothetical protein